MDKITLQEIMAYLPYQLKVLRPDGRTILDVEGVIGNTLVFHEIGKATQTYGEISRCKPLLRPLSQLTQEIEQKGERFVPIIELFKLKTQVTGSEIFDYYIENDTAILRLKGQQFEEITSKTFFEIDLEPNQVAFSIVSEIWEDDEMKQENINQCGNEMLMYQKLHEWHFDLYGLLGRGLAVEIKEGV